MKRARALCDYCKMRRSYLVWTVIALTSVLSCCLCLSPVKRPATSAARRPVVIDTDIGSFIDDSFAIVFALQSRLLDVKLILTCSENTTARAKITAKLLTLVGRDDIPIGIGVHGDQKVWHTLYDWAKDFDLSTYKGGVFSDGVGKMAEVIDQSSSVVDILAIGPMTNFPTLITKYPEVVAKANIKAMAGSVYKGYDNSSTPVVEYNVELCPECMQTLLSAGWNITLAPLDTTGVAQLTPAQMQRLFARDTGYELGLASSLLYFCTVYTLGRDVCTLEVISPHIHDTVATLLLLPQAEQFAVLKRLKLTVTADGRTVVDDQHGVPVTVALDWKSPSGLVEFQEFMTNLL